MNQLCKCIVILQAGEMPVYRKGNINGLAEY